MSDKRHETQDAGTEPSRLQKLESAASDLTAMVERLRAALRRIKGEEDPKAMKAIAEKELE